MPPKPFKPPRPSTTPGAKRPIGRPKGSTFKPKANAITKPKPISKKGKDKYTPSKSATSPQKFLLPQLSPDSDEAEHDLLEDEEEEDEIEIEDEEEEGEEQEDDIPTLKNRRKSATSTTSTSNPKLGGAKAKPKPRTTSNPNGHRAASPERKPVPFIDRENRIPEDLLNVLLHQHFKEKGKKGTKLTMAANKALGRYMETFVREAILRAAMMRSEDYPKNNGVAKGGALEVEDLEKMAPQLLLDF